MYETHFGWVGRPFPPVIQLEHYHPASTIDAARQVLVRCIHRAEGVGIVVGPSGTGKSLLSQILAAHFADTFQTVLLATGQLGSRRAVLQAILHGLKQPYRGMDAGELRLVLADYLAASPKCPNGMLLLIDEAHLLPSRLLDEIRLVTNLVVRGQPRARLVLAGDAALEERLSDPMLASFSQRIVARCYLEPFNRCETETYIARQIERVGGHGDRTFRPEACHAVYQASDGIPRLINQVCDHALMLGYSRGVRHVDAAMIQEAWAELQQLPSPWAARSKQPSQTGATIEFGGLDDDLQPALPAIAPQTTAADLGDDAFGAPDDDLETLDVLDVLDEADPSRSETLVAWHPTPIAAADADDADADADRNAIDPQDADAFEAFDAFDAAMGPHAAEFQAECDLSHDAPPVPVANIASNDDEPADLSGEAAAAAVAPLSAALFAAESHSSTVPSAGPAADVGDQRPSGCGTVFFDAYGLFGGAFQEEELVWDPTVAEPPIRNAVADTADAPCPRAPRIADEPRPGDDIPVLPLRQDCEWTASGDRSEVLVIEDDEVVIDANRGESPPHVAPVRSHQYSRLFSRLRRSAYGT